MKHPLEQFRFCPECGSGHFTDHDCKSRRCQDCGFTYYFNSAAATVAFIINGRNELLVCRRANEPARGTLDLPGGFIDLYETAEQGVAREVKEETGLEITRADYLFSIPNQYPYSGFTVHTLDLFFYCEAKEFSGLAAMDDAAELMFIPMAELKPEEFGLHSISQGVRRFLHSESQDTTLLQGRNPAFLPIPSCSGSGR